MSQGNDTHTEGKSKGPHAPSPFKLVSVEKTDAPQGGSEQTWYSYVLDNGRSKITGKYCGSLKAVTAYATQYAAGINARAGSGHSAWAPRAKKPVVSS
jgi:hypothetical protein